MAKKRKTSRQTAPIAGKSRDTSDSRLRIETFEDVADSEDEFHLNRDKVLIEEAPAAKRQRLIYEHDDTLEPSDEEILRYSSSPTEEYDDDQSEASTDDELAPQSSASRSSRRNKRHELDEGEPIEEEDQVSVQEEPDDFAESWGPSKRDYYNADVIETEQDALEEEAEAMRLQQKHLKNMAESDYGFDETEWSTQEPPGAEDDPLKHHAVVTETLPQLQISDGMSFPERLKLLKGRYPEFEPLSKDLLDLQERHREISEELAECYQIDGIPADGLKPAGEYQGDAKVDVLQVQHQALSLYLADLSLYFAFLTSTAAESDGPTLLPLSATDLRNHEIMENLVYSRNVWSKVRAMKVPGRRTDSSINGRPSPSMEETTNFEADAVHDVIAGNSEIAQRRTNDRTRKSRRSYKESQAQAEAAAHRAEKMREMEEDLATLDDLTHTKIRSKSRKPLVPKNHGPTDQDSDFGEEDQLTAQDIAEKANRRKSLRFYTSQIAQKSNKRGAAGRDAGGDMDIPYRERLKDRQARLNIEAEKRGKKKLGDATALGGESDEEDHRQAREVRGEEANGEDYYDMVAARSKQRKQDKRDRAQAYSQAAKEGGRVFETEGEIGADGKRAVSYAIMKNKGLTSKRSKDVRNPRVKKRKKFDQKKKKLASMKPIYKGGEGKGGYAVGNHFTSKMER
ncbi:MAG: hypothetical protein Q9165_005102 [Trypethelium subeluteriae]